MIERALWAWRLDCSKDVPYIDPNFTEEPA